MSQGWVLDAAERYRLESRIATGGMGEVWRGTDTVLDRPVAVKVLKDELAAEETFRSRFLAEARHAAALHHPSVASVFDFGETGGDGSDGEQTRPFLVMELVEGKPLSTLLRTGEPMPPEQAAALVAEAADALAVAHAMGIVHRDVKPANLLVTPDGRVKITDFGIARAAGGLALTQTGQIIGTPHYLSPEQAEGHPATPASDIYALGVVLYECLTGRRPFEGDSPVGTAMAHLLQPTPELPPEVPERLRGVVARAMAKDPSDRFDSAADMASALRGAAVADAAPAGPGPDGTRLLTPPPAPRRRTVLPGGLPGWLPRWLPWVAAAAAILVAVIVVAALTSGPSHPASPARRPASSPASAGTSSPTTSLVRVLQAGFLGMPAKHAADVLQRRGFSVSQSPIDNPGDQTGGTVAGIRPHGMVAPGTTLTLLVWSPPPPPPPPAEHGGPGKSDAHKPPPHDHGHGKAKGKKP